ncbi:hypothetical protein TRVL_03033 [Trypanosoma vivax]|uniref:RING-type domain-containing protein n=1 Tax=Trypanosoma vivax (strain Y486) TaxID=1055687 RepID=G0TW01_TRYVY|nr:hypothetical protein TRVL_03033 [Trypanosoma vivax]CCC48117.1 conserved hypothetical protein [Trypanosoma vivax Y486]
MAVPTPAATRQTIDVTLLQATLIATYEHPQLASLECLVCKLHLGECCLECRASTPSAGNCRVTRGGCGHLFHEHCILAWIQRRRECPACMAKWSPTTYIERD